MPKTTLRRLRDGEDGVALIVAMGALTVILLLTALAAAAAVQLSTSSNQDRNDKRAFQAAEAGLQVATYRMNKLVPGPTQTNPNVGDGFCITNAGAIPLVSGGCTGTGSLGDNASWSYYMTPVLFGGSCAGFPISYDPNNPSLSLAPRCITSSGTVNGVTRRVQARLVVFKGQPVFPLGGIICVTSCQAGNTVTVHTGAMGSNGLISVGNSSSVAGGLVLAPGAPTPTFGNSGLTYTYRSNEDGGWVLTPVDIGNTATTNNNGSWTFSSGSTYTWNSTTRQLNMSKGQLTLQGGVYNFCSIDIGNNATIAVAQGARAVIYIDSPARTSPSPGSGCAAGTGYIDANNNFDNPNTEPDGSPASEALQIYVFGGDPSPSKPALQFKNSSTLNAAIHAPNATVSFKNQASVYGAINANKVTTNNTLDFTWGGQGVASLRVNATISLFQRTAWRQCRPAPTTSDPSSGC